MEKEMEKEMEKKQTWKNDRVQRQQVISPPAL